MRDSVDEEGSNLKTENKSTSIRKASTHRPLSPTISEEVDEFIQQSIEIESNKKMKKDHLHWFSLTFKSGDAETKVGSATWTL